MGGGPPFRFGSGYLIGSGLVLTAGHILQPPGDDTYVPVSGDRCEVLPWGGDPQLGWLGGQVERCDLELDLAIVSVPGFEGGSVLVRWGRLDGIEPVQWKAIGFPVAGLDETGRQPETAWGQVSPATETFASRLGLVIGSRSARPTAAATSGWAGLSGAAVFCHDRLVGVVTEDPQKFAGSLTARRIDCLAEHPLLHAAAGSPMIEDVSAESPDESEWISNHAKAMEQEFLTRLGGGQAVSSDVAAARYVDVLVRSRPAVSGTAMAAGSRAVLLSKRLTLSGARVILTGEGGTGKTTILLRTVLDLCKRARADRDAPVAIYVRLNFFDAQTNGFGELMNVISRSAQLDRADAEALWAQRRRPCVFLLDGFNEVSPGARESCALALSELLQHRWHSYVITSRPGELIDKLARSVGAELWETVSLDDDQMQQFLDSYGLPDLLGRISPRLKDFLRTPFLLWALAQSHAGMPGVGLPSNIGQLYMRLIDDYIFGSREQAKSGEARPTRYHYERVKKPVLSEIAAEMCMGSVTRRPEDRGLLITIRNRLRELRTEYEGIYPIVPYELMPDPSAATELLEEVARNGVIRRADGTVEFNHESIRDYFAAVEIASWPLAKMVAGVPALIWRQVTLDFYDYRVNSGMVGPLTMIAGLRADPGPLIRALAERNLLIAAYCHAEAPTLSTAGYLAGLLSPMLQHWHPARRWIGCQCVGRAGLRSQKLIISLSELARSDPEVEVRDAAARALGRIDDHKIIQQLVTEALADIAPKLSLSLSPMSGRDSTRMLTELHSEIAVRDVFEAWRSETSGSDRGRRAEELLASMDPELVRKTLHSILTEGRTQSDGSIVQGAEKALSQLDTWERDGLIAPSRNDLYLWKLDQRRFYKGVETKLDELSACSTPELFMHMHHGDATVRVTAVTLLQQRHEPSAQDPLLEALGTETDEAVREALLDALRPLANQPGFMHAWSSRLTDPGWSRVAILDWALRVALPEASVDSTFRFDPLMATMGSYDELDANIRAELVRQGVSVPNDASVLGQPISWDVMPRGASPSIDMHREAWLRIVPAQGHLHVHDLGKCARLVLAGAALGERAVPVLRQVLHSDLSSPVVRAAVIEALAAIGGPAAVHELCAMLPTVKEEDQTTGPVDYPLHEAIAGIRSPHAIPQLLGALQALRPARFRWYPGSALTELNQSADAVITALLGIGAQAQLAEFAREASADADESLRHVATVTAARLDVATEGFGELLIRAAHATTPATRLVAVQALGQHETPSRRVVLIDACLHDQEEEVREEAAIAIRGYQGEEGIHDLITHLTQGDSRLRARAADALRLIGDDLAVTSLANVLRNGPSRLQISAAHALRELEPSHTERLIDPLVTIAATDADIEIRTLAVKELEEVPGGTGRLFAPVYEALDAGRYQEALEQLGDDAPLFADSFVLRWLRALTLRELQRQSEALDDVDAVLHEMPDWTEAVRLRVELLFSLDRGDEGLMAIKEAAEHWWYDPDLQAALGWWSYVSGQLEESIRASRRALKLQPDRIDTRLNLGLALLAHGDDALAEQSYRQAIEQASLGDRSDGVTKLTTAIEELDELARETDTERPIATAVRNLLQAAVDNLNAVKRAPTAEDAAGID